MSRRNKRRRLFQPSGTLRYFSMSKGIFLRSLGQYDFLVALVLSLMLTISELLSRRVFGIILDIGLNVSGVILGIVIAGAAIQAAFMDQEFLRKVSAIGKNPVTYIMPFLFTATLTILVLLISILAKVAETLFAMPAPASATATFFISLLICWAVLSLLPCLAMLAQFVQLKSAAAKTDD